MYENIRSLSAYIVSSDMTHSIIRSVLQSRRSFYLFGLFPGEEWLHWKDDLRENCGNAKFSINTEKGNLIHVICNRREPKKVLIKVPRLDCSENYLPVKFKNQYRTSMLMRALKFILNSIISNANIQTELWKRKG